MPSNRVTVIENLAHDVWRIHSHINTLSAVAFLVNQKIPFHFRMSSCSQDTWIISTEPLSVLLRVRLSEIINLK